MAEAAEVEEQCMLEEVPGMRVEVLVAAPAQHKQEEVPGTLPWVLAQPGPRRQLLALDILALGFAEK